VFGPTFRDTQQRGVLLPWPQDAAPQDDVLQNGRPQALATIHPSAVLRADDRDTALAGLVADLRVVADLLR